MQHPATQRARWRFGFGTLLVLTMASSTLMPVGLGILAPFMRDDLGVSRTQIGVLITTVTLGAAMLSPLSGRVTDALGGRRATVVLLVTAVTGFAGTSLAPGYWWMILPVGVAAIAQAGGNPSTNKLIAHHAPAGRRGIVTGIKQSGVQAGVFAAGVLMPVAAETWGWRWAMGATVGVPVIALALAALLLPADGPDASEVTATRGGPLPPAITFLAVYGALMGFGAAYTFFLPLFAEEALGMSERAGGLAAGLVGLISLGARIGWSRRAELQRNHDATLAAIAVGSIGAAGLLLWAQAGLHWLLWPGAILTGATSSSWNSVGMLATIEHAGPQRSGRASGIVMLGFLGGLGAAPTAFGRLIDATGSYTAMWLTSIACLVAAAIAAVWWTRRQR
jgi:predicted MFS family arabinose efflux permease